MSNSCIGKHFSALGARHEALVKSGLGDKEAAIKAVTEEHKRLHNELNSFKKKIGVATEKYVAFDSSKAVQAVKDNYNQQISVKQSIKASTEGGIQGEVTITNKQALKTQIQTLNRGIKEGLFQQKSNQKDLEVRKADIRGQVTGFLKSFQNTDFFKGAKIPANYIATITTKLDKALASADFTTARSASATGSPAPRRPIAPRSGLSPTS